MSLDLKCYGTFRTQTEGAANFAVLGCYAIPALKSRIAAGQPLPVQHVFPHDQSTAALLNMHAAGYKNRLACYLWLSSFSFFEAFAHDAISEVFEFHGGCEVFQKRAYARSLKFVGVQDADIAKFKRRLQTWSDPRKHLRYKKYGDLLKAKGYCFPSELFVGYGVKMLAGHLGKNFRSADIPTIYRDAMHLSFTEPELRHFEECRTIRHKIAHGKAVSLSLRKVVGAIKDLSSMARSINRHLVDNFLIIEL